MLVLRFEINAATSDTGALRSYDPYVVTMTNTEGSYTVDSTNLLVKFLADARDVGNTVSVSVTAYGAGGNTATATTSFAVKATALEVSTSDIILEGSTQVDSYQLTWGPVKQW